jgi:transposase
MDKEADREQIVAEYVRGGVSYRELGRKYGLNHRQIHRWVKAYRRGVPADKERRYTGEQVAEIRRLRKELEDARLKNELLTAMIDIAEEQMGVDIRKKRGAKR